jgi:hypothetical protein
MIACPGGDFCSLANARSLHIAAAVTERYQDLDELFDLGPIDLHMSGCINSAATTTAATSASWASTRTARSGTRSRWAAPTARAVRPRHWRQGGRPLVHRRRSAGRDRGRARPPSAHCASPASSSSMPCAASATTRSSRRPTRAPCQGRRSHALNQRFQNRYENNSCRALPTSAETEKTLQIANDAELAEIACQRRAGRRGPHGAAVSQVHRRPRLQPGPAAAPPLQVCGRHPRHGRCADRPAGAHAPQRLHSAVLAPGQDASAAERQFARFSAFYQGDVLEPRPLFAREAA